METNISCMLVSVRDQISQVREAGLSDLKRAEKFRIASNNQIVLGRTPFSCCFKLDLTVANWRYPETAESGRSSLLELGNKAA